MTGTVDAYSDHFDFRSNGHGIIGRMNGVMHKIGEGESPQRQTVIILALCRDFTQVVSITQPALAHRSIRRGSKPDGQGA